MQSSKKTCVIYKGDLKFTNIDNINTQNPGEDASKFSERIEFLKTLRYSPEMIF